MALNEETLKGLVDYMNAAGANKVDDEVLDGAMTAEELSDFCQGQATILTMATLAQLILGTDEDMFDLGESKFGVPVAGNDLGELLQAGYSASLHMGIVLGLLAAENR